MYVYIYIYIVKKADEKHCHYHIDWESAHMVSGWSWLDKSTVVNIIVDLVNILTFQLKIKNQQIIRLIDSLLLMVSFGALF